MSAHRLISTLLLLQQRGTVTAAEVAEELEVSQRTARRDLEALATAGVPVYSRAGRGGGWSLVGGARTDLSGLHANEARALFLVAGPAANASPALKSALRKLVRALPDTFRSDAASAADAVVIDPSQWGHERGPDPEHLGVVQHAVVEGRRLRLEYTDRRGAGTERLVDPLGVVDKRGAWYLVAGTPDGQRTFRIDRIRSAVVTDERVVRPADFDLERAWRDSSSRFVGQWDAIRVELLVDDDVLHLFRTVIGDRSLTVGDRAADGRHHVEMRSVSAEAAAGRIAGFGTRVEALGPAEVRERLAAVGVELVAGYGAG